MTNRALVADYMRSLARYLDRHWALTPTTRDACPVTAHEYETPRERWSAWCADSLHTGWQDFARGDVKYAWRGLLQARQYAALATGSTLWPSSVLEDAYIALQNAVEATVFANAEEVSRVAMAQLDSGDAYHAKAFGNTA